MPDNQSETVAVVGAGGFFGSRFVESAFLGGWANIVPIVRSVSGLPRLSRFKLSWRTADAANVSELAAALKDCTIAVHAIVGDPSKIEAAANALMPAARQANVRRIIFLSSASVHGQNTPVGTTEQTQLSARQPIGYNNAKVRSEWALQAVRTHGGPELVILRPSIVFGPRDRWVSVIAREIRQKIAWLIEDGAGICNSIYVDNLVTAVRCAMTANGVDGEVFFVGDDATVTWRQFYDATAKAIGFDPATIATIPTPPMPERNLLEGLRTSTAAQRVLRFFPKVSKRLGKALIKAWSEPVKESIFSLPGKLRPNPSLEMVLLQQCQYRLPQDKAIRLLGYRPEVTFEEGIARTAAWLKWGEV